MKLVIEEPESAALEGHLADRPVLTTSRIAAVEVPRATALANPGVEVQRAVATLLASCLLVDVTADLLLAAAGLSSRTLRTLEAIHLASALRVEPDELVAYDRRLIAAAARHGLLVTSPGRTA